MAVRAGGLGRQATLDPGGIEDLHEWLAAMIEEAEAGYADDARYPLSGETQAINYGLSSPEPGC